MTKLEQALYFAENGWPLTIKGEPKQIPDLDHAELLQIAKRYAATLVTEMASVTTREKLKTGYGG